MIKGIGLDLIELDRMNNVLNKNNRLVNRILTQSEQKVFHELKSDRRKVEYLAGRFSAKEAFSKATGDGIGKLSFQDIEVLTNKKGAPFIKARGYCSEKIFVSITHSKEYAAAQVIIEEK